MRELSLNSVVEIFRQISRKCKGVFPISVFLVFFLFLITACDNRRIYEEWYDMSDNVWDEDSLCNFTFEIEDSLSLYNLNFGIRNTNLYPYQNLWLLTSIDGGSDNFSYQDTIQFELATEKGEWYGDCGASVYTYVAPLYRHLKFYSAGEYTLSIKHGMRKEVLNGVSSVGFRIEKIE